MPTPARPGGHQVYLPYDEDWEVIGSPNLSVDSTVTTVDSVSLLGNEGEVAVDEGVARLVAASSTKGLVDGLSDLLQPSLFFVSQSNQ